MDVAIAVFGDTPKEMQGLKRSLSSLARFGEGLERVIVIGRVPTALESAAPNIVAFRMPPMRFGLARHDLVLDGIVKAIHGGILCGDFLYCPLGVTLAAPTDLPSYPRFCRRARIRSIAEMVQAGKGGAVVTKYWLSVTDTRRLLERNGLSAIDFSGRFLSHMDAADVLDVEALWGQEPHAAFGYEPACLFGNVRESKVAAAAPRWVEWRG